MISRILDTKRKVRIFVNQKCRLILHSGPKIFVFLQSLVKKIKTPIERKAPLK